MSKSSLKTQELRLAEVNVAVLASGTDPSLIVEFETAMSPRLDDVGALRGFRGLLGSKIDEVDLSDVDKSLHHVINITVWPSVETLWEFMRVRENRQLLRKYQSLYEKNPKVPSLALWWVNSGYIPSIMESIHRLETLRRNGPTNIAFGLSSISDFNPGNI